MCIRDSVMLTSCSSRCTSVGFHTRPEAVKYPSMTDGCLRGLGQQTRCMAINVLDATLGVVLVWVLLPRFGLAGYIFILYFNECVNFTLSFTLLLRTVRRICGGKKPPAG